MHVVTKKIGWYGCLADYIIITQDLSLLSGFNLLQDYSPIGHCCIHRYNNI